MPTQSVRNTIRETAEKCAVRTVSPAFIPGLYEPTITNLWADMMKVIAVEHSVIFEVSPMSLANTLSLGLAAYYKQLSILIGYLFGGYMFSSSYNPKVEKITNAITNAYLTWSIGTEIDRLIILDSCKMIDNEFTKKLLRCVCHMPNRNEFYNFRHDISLSVEKINSWLN